MKHLIKFPSGLWLISPKGKFDGNWSGVNCTANLCDATTYDSLSTAEAVASMLIEGTVVQSMVAKDLFMHRLGGTA